MDWDDPDLNFADYSSNGVVGTPVHATPELGEILWKKVVESVAEILKDIAESRDRPGVADMRRPG